MTCGWCCRHFYSIATESFPFIGELLSGHKVAMAAIDDELPRTIFVTNNIQPNGKPGISSNANVIARERRRDVWSWAGGRGEGGIGTAGLQSHNTLCSLSECSSPESLSNGGLFRGLRGNYQFIGFGNISHFPALLIAHYPLNRFQKAFKLLSGQCGKVSVQKH